MRGLTQLQENWAGSSGALASAPGPVAWQLPRRHLMLNR